MSRFLDHSAALFQGKALPGKDRAVLLILAGLLALPSLLYFSGAVFGAAAEGVALVALIPCGIAAGRIGSAWRRARHLRAYWA